MTNSEIEAQIGANERLFDLAKDRPRELELALKSLEDALDRTMNGFHYQQIRQQIQKIESDLTTARNAMVEARTALEASWSLRAQQNGEDTAHAMEEKRE